MRPMLKWLGTGLLFLVVAISLAPTLVPPFLDRIYYRGPASGHFDGERFFNPEAATEGASRGGERSFLGRWMRGEGRAEWPSHVPVTPVVPPARIEGERMLVTWVGHATVLVQTEGLNILTDPIWSERASPFSFIGPKRVRAPGIAFQDLPKIDLVLVSHNHYDHLDLATLERLWRRDRPLIVTSLGNDTIMASRGIEARVADWEEAIPVRPGVEVAVERNHHWSSRWFTDRNRALWSAFTVRLPGGNVFFAGDTGIGDAGWIEAAKRSGPYRLALIPIGAYEPRDFMKRHHVNPEEAMRIFEALDPVRALGIHWGTFQLTFEPINDPLDRLAALRGARGGKADGFIATEVGRTFSVPAGVPAGAR